MIGDSMIKAIENRKPFKSKSLRKTCIKGVKRTTIKESFFLRYITLENFLVTFGVLSNF